MQANGHIPRYTLWIEAEVWGPGQWNPVDDNTDVIVTFDDRSRWVTTFFSYANIATLVTNYRRSGESLGGKYFWSSDMILVDEVSRKRIEEVVAHLLHEGNFKRIFTRLDDADDDADDDDQEWQRLIARYPLGG
jgi:hypothetical protein